MTQTNTTQNKEELSKEQQVTKLAIKYFKEPYWGFEDEILELLSQAHQSGIEEERKSIRKK